MQNQPVISTQEKSNKDLLALCKSQKKYFESGITMSYDFRKKQLLKIRKMLRQHEGEILKALKEDLGKPAFEAYASEIGFVHTELSQTLKNLKLWMRPQRVRTSLVNWPAKSFIRSEPKGVSLIIAPWNYPFNLIFVPLIASIAAGNTAILKPAEQTPHTARLIERLVTTHFEPQYISVVQGKGAEVIPKMMDSFRFDHVFFTGSVAVGKQIAKMAAPNLTPITLELGGKSPAIVDRKAKLKVAARRIVFGKFLNAGQTCIAPDYLLVHLSLKDDFVAQLKKTLQEFYGDEPLKSEHYAQIINEGHLKRLQSFFTQNKVIYGGKADAENCRLEPTILDEVDPESAVMKEEIFGPILPVISYQTDEEALGIIGKNPYPLALYVFTSDKAVEKLFTEKVQFGGGAINNALVHFVDNQLPFGGVGSSGYGHYHGKAGFDTFSHHKSIIKSATWFDPAQKYPPYRNSLLKLLKRLMR